MEANPITQAHRPESKEMISKMIPQVVDSGQKSLPCSPKRVYQLTLLSSAVTCCRRQRLMNDCPRYNVLSALMRKAPQPKVIAWLDGQPRSSVWTTAISVLEIRFGLQIMSLGKRRASLINAFERVLSEKIERRVAPFDILAAQEAANLMAMRKEAGHAGDLRDAMIAGIVVAARATLATHNTRHFSDLPVPVVDPWESSEK